MVRVSMVTLVTGATGLVGNAIVRSLVERRREVRVLARTPDKARRLVPEGVDVVRGDVTEGDSLKRAFEGVSVAYHAAGLPEQWLPDEGTFDRVNVEGTANMIEAALAANVKRFVHTSTTDVFRAALGEEYDESVIDPEPKGTAYERSKQAADRAVVKALSRGLPAVFLHPAAVYGDGPAGSPGLNDFVDKLVKRQAPALLPGGTEIQFRPHLRRGLRIGIGGRIQHPIAARMDPRAGRLARSGRDSLHVAGGQIEQVDLVERIRGVAFRLEDQALAVATEIALAGPPSLERKLPGIGQPACLVVGLVGRTRHRHQHDGAKRCDACPVPRRARDAAPTRRLTAAHDTHLNIPRD